MLSEGGALRQMYRITSDYERPFNQQVRDLLSLGRTYLDVEVGYFTKIYDETQLIVEASGDHKLVQPGESCPLSESYCRETIEREDALTVQYAKVEGWEKDTAYERFGFESYLGAKVVVDGDTYGTFCFADSNARDRPFTDKEEVFGELMAEWVSSELLQQRATEQIQEQRDQLEEFTRVVSHDLRNPLSVVQGYLDLAEKEGHPEHFDRCRNALDRMELLIDDLLTLSQEGDAIGKTETIQLSELVTECWSFVATEEATLEAETEVAIKGDWSRLQQLFENLFRNAIEHGGSDVTIRVGDLEDGSRVYVEDDGSGISLEDRNRVFDDGYSTDEKGIGLGLTIVQQTVDAHGWEISVTEGVDGGARFEITGINIVKNST